MRATPFPLRARPRDRRVLESAHESSAACGPSERENPQGGQGWRRTNKNRPRPLGTEQHGARRLSRRARVLRVSRYTSGTELEGSPASRLPRRPPGLCDPPCRPFGSRVGTCGRRARGSCAESSSTGPALVRVSSRPPLPTGVPPRRGGTSGTPERSRLGARHRGRPISSFVAARSSCAGCAGCSDSSGVGPASGTYRAHESSKLSRV